MPQKGLKKVMGLGEAEKTFLKSFFRFPKYQHLSGSELKSPQKVLRACHVQTEFSSAEFKCQDEIRAVARDCGIKLFTYDDNPFIHHEDKIRVRTR